MRMLQADVDAPERMREMTPAIRQAIAQAWREAGGELLSGVGRAHDAATHAPFLRSMS